MGKKKKSEQKNQSNSNKIWFQSCRATDKLPHSGLEPLYKAHLLILYGLVLEQEREILKASEPAFTSRGRPSQEWTPALNGCVLWGGFSLPQPPFPRTPAPQYFLLSNRGNSPPLHSIIVKMKDARQRPSRAQDNTSLGLGTFQPLAQLLPWGER